MNTIVIDRKKYVLVPVADYQRLMAAKKAAAPTPDADGAVAAVAFAEASIARGIVRRRKAVGLSQKQLAEAAGVRVEVLNRAERGVTVPSVRTLSKIEEALKKA